MNIDKKLNELEKISKKVERKTYSVKVNEEIVIELKNYLTNYNILATDFFENIIDINELRKRNRKYEESTNK